MTAAIPPLEQSVHGSASRTEPRWAGVAAALYLCSAAAQLLASLQRWVDARGSWSRSDRTVEDHLFDYSYPADPWENLGDAAQIFGVGYLMLALGVLVMGLGAERRRTAASTTLASLVAFSFAVDGGHALVSGLLGSPSPVQYVILLQLLVSLVGCGALIALGCLWLRNSPARAAACLFLLGATVPGYLVAAFIIAPAVAGYQSYDTTPFTETVVAASTAAAGIALAAAAVSGLLSATVRPR